MRLSHRRAAASLPNAHSLTNHIEHTWVRYSPLCKAYYSDNIQTQQHSAEFWKSKACFEPTVLDNVENALNNLQRRKVKHEETTRRAAVLVPLCNRNGIASVLLTKRADTLTLHKGEVAFPGGLEEAADEGNLVKTAIRETEEELGYSRSQHIDILGLWHDALSKTSIPVTPVVGFLGDWEQIEPHIKPNPEEIGEVFTLTLGELLDESKFEYQTWTPASTWRGKIKVKVFKAGPYPVWGLTAHILDHLVDKVIVPAFSGQPLRPQHL